MFESAVVPEDVECFGEGVEYFEAAGEDRHEGIAAGCDEADFVRKLPGDGVESAVIEADAGERSDAVGGAFGETAGLECSAVGQVFFDVGGFEVIHGNAPSGGGAHISFIHGVFVGVLQGREFPIAVELGKGECGAPAGGVSGEAAACFESGDEVLEFFRAWGSVKSAHSDINGMDGAAAEHFEELIAVFFQGESAIDFVGKAAGQFDAAGGVEEVRCLEQVDVQRVAFDPFGAVEQASEAADFGGDADAQGFFERLHGGELIGHGADTADAGGEVGDFFERSSAEEGFEESWRFVDGELYVADSRAFHVDIQGTLAFNAGECFDADGASCGHGRDSGIVR
ncbi:MAG: hypothetical protein RLZZ436_3835 [Planctomycetota bacterium]